MAKETKVTYKIKTEGVKDAIEKVMQIKEAHLRS